MKRFNRRDFLKVAVISAIGAIGVIGGLEITRLARSTSSSTPISRTTTGISPPISSSKFIEIKAFENNNYIAKNNYSANELLSLISSIHSAVGDFNLIRFIRTECASGVIDPGTSFSDWNGTMDTYFLAVKQACGGEIIPDCDMDIYFGASDCGGIASPQAFFANSASLLNLSAIANGERYVMLESWAPSFYSHVSPSQSDIQNFFQKLIGQGWSGFMPQSNNPGDNSFHDFDYGYAGYQRVGLFDVETSPPYLRVTQNFINSMWQQEPYLHGILTGIESQILNNSSSIAQFADNLTLSQQIEALTTVAQNQQSGKYIFIYPVLVNQGANYGGPVWDAKAAGALNAITNLMNQYNSS